MTLAQRGEGRLPGRAASLGGRWWAAAGLVPALAAATDEGIGKDAEEPGFRIGARLEPAESGVCTGERFLDPVVGVGPVAGQAQGGGIQLSAVSEQIAFETPGPLLWRFSGWARQSARPGRRGWSGSDAVMTLVTVHAPERHTAGSGLDIGHRFIPIRARGRPTEL